MDVHPFYISNGLRVHEIRRGLKCPVEVGWPDSNKSYEEVRYRLQEEEFNKYGWLLDDCHVVIDIDVHNEKENGYESLARLEEDLGYRLEDVCKAIVYSPSGGRHYYFSKPVNARLGKVFKEKYPGIDFISGKGKQVIAAGSAHDTYPGKVYELSENAGLASIPTSLLEHLQSLRQDKPEARHFPTSFDGERSGDEFNKSSRGLRLLLAEMEARGYAIRSKGDYYEFDRPGKSTSSKCSGHVGKVSKQGNYQLACFTLSDSYFPSGESVTIFHAYALLCFRGDESEAATALYQRGFAETDNSDVNISAICTPPSGSGDEEQDEDTSPVSPGDFPREAIPENGIIGDVVRLNIESAMYPQPELAFASALALMGAITGRRVESEHGTRTNVYILGLGESGSGKEHGRKLNKSLLNLCGAELLGPERIGSHAGLTVTVREKLAVLLQLDEVDRLLETMKNPGKSPHLYNIATVLMQMYSSSDAVWIGDAYADPKKVPVIEQPHPVVYGTCTPDRFWESITADSVTNGLLGRMMVFESPGLVSYQSPVRKEPSRSLVEAIQWWATLLPGGLGWARPKPIVANHTEDALARYQTHLQQICEKQAIEGKKSALWSRTGEKTAKLALLFACSRQQFSTTIKIALEDVDRAILVSNWLTRRMISQAFAYVATNAVEEAKKRVLRIISESGKNGATMTDLYKRTQWLRKKEREEITHELQMAGLIESVEIATKGRPRLVFRRRNKG
jgi:hypothetical protein